MTRLEEIRLEIAAAKAAMGAYKNSPKLRATSRECLIAALMEESRLEATEAAR